MSRKSRSYEQAFTVPIDVKVKLVASPESALEFQNRIEAVQSLIMEMILLGRKKGRPSVKEDEHEKAA